MWQTCGGLSPRLAVRVNFYPRNKPEALSVKGRRISTGMPNPRDEQRLELLQGTLDLLVLRSLQLGHQHGRGIGQAIRA